MDLTEPPVPILPVDSHHMPFVLLFDMSDENSIKLDNRVDDLGYDFINCDFNQLNEALADVRWHSLLQRPTVNESISSFYDKLFEVCSTFVPRKRKAVSSVFNEPWWTSELRHLRNVLRKARRRFFLSKSETDRINLRELETSYKSLLLSTHEAYLTRIQDNVKQNPSGFWNFVKKQKSSARVPNNVNYNDVHAASNVEAANLFASFFESVFSKVSPVCNSDSFAHIPSHDIHLPMTQFSAEEVVEAINDLDIKKGPGTDGIPPVFLKNCSGN